MVRAGDRLLSSYQHRLRNHWFSTYSDNDNDAFRYEASMSEIPLLSEGRWIYTYMAYSKAAGQVQCY
jgi:hypothetical protein